jgi:pyruvate-ferredoxin/flavodoxin oxidoreductase
MDGATPSGTTKYERRSAALEIPVWDADSCAQCNECAFVCPHASIRPFLVTPEDEKTTGVVATKAKGKGYSKSGFKYSITVSPLGCMGCGVCAEQCPEGSLEMTPIGELDIPALAKTWDQAVALPNRSKAVEEKRLSIKGSQFRQPLLEFSGACAGCSETGYAKLLTQLYGDHMYIANATGCSMIWGNHFPSMSYCTNEEGHGPAWGNSLFEDNAEYGYGMARATSHRRESTMLSAATTLLQDPRLCDMGTAALTEWVENINDREGSRDASYKVKAWLDTLPEKEGPVLALEESRDLLAKPSHWIIGGDGWAYDIGFGGVDHVLAQDDDVNLFVFDNEAYANTGFQRSKATPHGAVAMFAQAGHRGHKKDLGLMMMSYGHIYVASIALGADPRQALAAVQEAEAYPGPSVVLGYTTCLGHGLHETMSHSMSQMTRAVDAGYWPLYRYDPRKAVDGASGFTLDSEITGELEDFLNREVRFTSLMNANPELATGLRKQLQLDVDARWQRLEKLASS